MKKIAKAAIFSGAFTASLYGINKVYPNKPLNDSLKILESIARGSRVAYFVNFN